jgi:hypothetical protein
MSRIFQCFAIVLALCEFGSPASANSAKPKVYFLSALDPGTLKGSFPLHWGYLRII